MSLKSVKLELFYIRKAFLQYHKGFKYLTNKYFLAPKILKTKKVFEKAINNSDLSIHVLTSHRDLKMLVWALVSFYRVTEVAGQLYIHSDGSLTRGDIKKVKDFFPSAIIIKPKEFLDKYLAGIENYPVIKKLRAESNEFFLLKKLIDPYAVSEKKWHLIIDSDLLWFSQPAEIKRAMESGQSLMIEGSVGFGEPNYIYFNDSSKIDSKLANLNSGIVLYQKENFNLDRLTEYFNKFDFKNEKNKHFIEQAGYAYCLDDLISLPIEKYQIQKEIGDQTVVRHYTSPKRPLFYIEGLEKLKNKIL